MSHPTGRPANGVMRRLASDERGISAVVVVTVMVTMFCAAVLSIDFGALWNTRRAIITATDAAALDAANAFAAGPLNGGLDPCSTMDLTTAETHATTVLRLNDGSALHDETETPDGFEVTLADPSLCGSRVVPGKVRFDGRLLSRTSFAGTIGVEPSTAFSSSTAAWGYITAIGEGLRPIAICDQSTKTFPSPLPAPPAAPYYPHYELWKQLFFGTIDRTTYDSFFGTDPDHYPSTSSGYILGDSNDNPNDGLAYVAPDGSNGHHTVHRIAMPDGDCGNTPGNRVWVDFYGPGGGTVGTSELIKQLLYGYKGTVALEPHDCNPSNSTPTPEDCGSSPGNHQSIARQGLAPITCPVATPALQCPYIFPILVMDYIVDPGSTANYHQVAFLFVVLRGFGRLINNEKLQIDIEMVNLQTTGQVSASPPSGGDPYLVGVQLCGADHDTVGDRCPF